VRLLRATTHRVMRELSRKLKQRGRTIGFVPTMGALHQGHLSLVRLAARNADRVVVSIFVNPMQFGAGEDFANYPRDRRRDLELLAGEKVDAVYLPDEKAMYPEGYSTSVAVKGLGEILEGDNRPDHFTGVCTVVLKLLNAVEPDVMWLGQKDAQQCVVLERMIRDLDLPVKLRRGPTVREPDGLAISSRNAYLTPEEREQAAVLHQALTEAKGLAQDGVRDPVAIRERVVRRVVTSPRARLDYVEVVDARTLSRLEELQGEVLIALGCRFGRARLIDNVQFRIPRSQGKR
jgi:pantoate--beta-alanine ligase